MINLEKYIDLNYKAIKSSLGKDSSLIIKVNEAEGIPSDCISWIDSEGKLNYYLIEYDGRG